MADLTAEEIYELCEELGVQRARARGALHKAEGELAKALAVAKAHPDTDMSKAVKLAGVGRTMGYKLINQRVQSD